MIRVDYSGLNWELVGEKTDKICRLCGGTLMYSNEYKVHFCRSCGRWVENKGEINTDKPQHPIHMLNKIYYNKYKNKTSN